MKNKNFEFILIGIKIFLFSLFAWRVILGLNQILYELSYFCEGNQSSNFLHLLIYRPYFRPALLLIPAFIGVFIKRRIGWILMISYVYFLTINGAFTFILDGNYNFQRISIFTGVILILFLVIWLSNRKSITIHIYNFKKDSFLMRNILASILGLVLTLLLAYSKS